MSKIKVLMGPASSEVSLLGLQTAVFSPCPPVVFPLCVCVLISSSYGVTSQTGLGPPPYDLILNKLKIFSPSAVTF